MKKSLFLITALFILFTTNGIAQSYPKLYSDGNVLAITAFQLEKKEGSGWVKAAQYEHNAVYRFKIRFTNYSRAAIPVLGSSFGSSGKAIAHISVDTKVALGKFHDNGSNSTRQIVLRCNPNDHSCCDVISPEISRWFTLPETFAWHGPPASFSKYPIEIYTAHREIVYIPPAKWGTLIPK